ncbi:MAG: protein-L-isoaspartate(D-aspartate) O-methyltransferase [Anaerolineales bacterium]
MQKILLFLSISCLFLLFFSSCTAENGNSLDSTPSKSDVIIGQEPSFSPNEIDRETDDIKTEKEYSILRQALVEKYIETRGIVNQDVIRAMKNVPRHKFVLDEYIDYAYHDHALPIGYGQTISQPYIVALMTELLDLKKDSKVLEIGTGSGYQAAVLEELGYVDVYTMEIVPELAERAAKILEETGYSDIHVKQGDGYYGWEEFAPYDAIIVTAAPDHLPAPLVDQLKDGGVLVIPIGPPGGYQTLWCFYKEGEELTTRNYGSVIFVPFTGGGVETSP